MKIGQFLRESKERLTPRYGEREGRAIAIRLLQHYLEMEHHHLIMEEERLIEEERLKELREAMEQLLEGRPLQYVTGVQFFDNLKIEVEEGVLIPRPESEELVRWVAEEFAGREGLKILDIGTGSGALIVALGVRFPTAKLFALDLSPKALEVAAKNLLKEGREATLFSCNLLSKEGLTTIEQQVGREGVDLIISNPPYVRESEKSEMTPTVLNYEPEIALFVPDHDPLLFYRELERVAATFLKAKGGLFMEINEAFGKETAQFFDSPLYSRVELRRDLHGKERMLFVERGDN